MDKRIFSPVVRNVPSDPTTVYALPTTANIVFESQSSAGNFVIVYDSGTVSAGDYAKLPNGSMIISAVDHKLYVKDGAVGGADGTPTAV